MKPQSLSFHVRLRDASLPARVEERVGRALGLSFAPSTSKLFSGRTAVETRALGIWMTLAFIEETGEHWFVGDRDGDDLSGSEALDISAYVVALLHERDSPQWYVPSRRDLMASHNG